MSNSCFYHGDDQAIVDRLRCAATSTWGAVKEKSVDSFWLFIPHADYDWSFGESRDALGVVSGYVRCDDLEHISVGHCSPGQRQYNS